MVLCQDWKGKSVLEAATLRLALGLVAVLVAVLILLAKAISPLVKEADVPAEEPVAGRM